MKSENKNIVFLTLGIPGSGKSTWSKNKIEKNPHIVRISRDGLREMLNFYTVLDPGLEKNITSLQMTLLKELLSKNKSVIIDNTNTRSSYIKDFLEICRPFKVPVELIDFSDVSLKVCLERNKNRERIVPEDIIKKMHNSLLQSKEDSWKAWGEYMEDIKKDIPVEKFYKDTLGLPEAIIVDLDGTLADNTHRNPFDETLVKKDKLIQHVYDQLILNKNAGRKIIICSGRTDSCKQLCEEWLQENKVPYDYIFMRKTGDMRKDSVIKREIFMEHINERYNVKAVFDDRLAVVKLWHNLGLPLFRVGNPESIF